MEKYVFPEEEIYPRKGRNGSLSTANNIYLFLGVNKSKENMDIKTVE